MSTPDLTGFEEQDKAVNQTKQNRANDCDIDSDQLKVITGLNAEQH